MTQNALSHGEHGFNVCDVERVRLLCKITS